MTLFFLALGWLAGIALARELGIPWWGWAILSGFTIPPLIITRHRPNWRTLFGLLLLLGLGALRFSLSEKRLDAHDLAYYNDQGFATIEGMIADMPDVRDTHVNLEIKTDQIIIEDEEVKNYLYTGTFNNETLEQALNALRIASDIHYTIDKDTILIYMDD